MSNTFPFNKSWAPFLQDEFDKSYMKDLLLFLQDETSKGKIIHPHDSHIFEAFNKTHYENVKVIILGQDPYHGPGQAHGLAFSVQKGVKIPPSLLNIYKELESDLGIKPCSHGNLTSWAERGVLLLNNVLTVHDGLAASHHNRGWEIFTSRVIEVLNNKKENLIFILWGSPAQKKASIVDASKHFIIKSPHPSPLSSYRGFFGSKPFSKTNDFLKSKKLKEIDWQIL